MRLAYYAGVSTAAAAACLLKAFHQRPNFYSATVYLSQSNACLLILTNLVLVMVCSFIYGLQRVLYGPLRPIEIEQLSEKAWYAVLDTLLAMPSFREDVGGWLLAMFTLLLAGKVWGWIGEGRVDVLEQQPPANPRLFHLRLATSLLVSVIFDFWMLHFCVETVVADPRPGMMVIFTFEFAVLAVFSLFTLARYGLSVLQIRIEKQQTEKAIEERKEEIKAERAAARQSEAADGAPTPVDAQIEEPIEVDENELELPGWEEKRRYLFALEVLTDFVKLLIYIVFFTVSITFNGLPMHIMRDVYMTFASFTKRVADFIAYRKATSDMNSRYPDATTEEIRGDSCIVCRETMVAWEQPGAQQDAQPVADQPAAAAAAAAVPTRRRDEGLRAKKLPCGHILHLRCLKAWLERQQVCPTCRRPVVTAENSAQPPPGGAGGGANAAPDRPPQPRRQGRARIFNLGPVRIGFLNGPGDQLGNVVRQMQNPNAAPGQNGAQQQGPNHLGLQEPYAADGAATDGGRPNRGGDASARSATPIQIQLLQLEQRLLQEAHNLHLEQRQLATLHAMESELARLRTFHIPAQQPVGTGTAAQRVNPIAGPLPQMQTPMWGVNGGSLGAQLNAVPTPEMLQGSVGQSIGNGHDGLPEGMVLPDGWTVMPLQHVGGGGPAMETRSAPMQSDATEASEAELAPARVGGAGSPGQATATTRADADTSALRASNVAEIPPAESSTAVGPTDEGGSPLFVPTRAETNEQSAARSQTEAAGSAVPVTSLDGTGQPAEPTAATSTAAQASPWNAGDWDFADRPQHENTGAATEPASTTSHASDKGKGRAVEVEDAPDPGT